jgi:hypothetical protein
MSDDLFYVNARNPRTTPHAVGGLFKNDDMKKNDIY